MSFLFQKREHLCYNDFDSLHLKPPNPIWFPFPAAVDQKTQ